MPEPALTKQFILDAAGKPIGVILPLAEYQDLLRSRSKVAGPTGEATHESLYGILRHLGGQVADTASLDEARRLLWSVWDRTEQP